MPRLALTGLVFRLWLVLVALSAFPAFSQWPADARA